MKKVFFYLAVAIVTLFFTFPLFWLLLNSFHSIADITSYPPDYFAPVTGRNYARLFIMQELGFVEKMRNSLLFSSLGTVIALAVAAPGAFIIAKFRHPIIGLVILTSQMCPFILYLIPLYMFFIKLGLLDTLIGLTIGYLMLSIPMAAWLLIGFFANIPPELEEAGLMDGASRFTAFRRIVLPMAFPALIAVGILIFAGIWHNLIIPLILGGSRAATLPVMLASFVDPNDPHQADILAASVLTIAPILLLITVARKYIVRVMMSGRIG